MFTGIVEGLGQLLERTQGAAASRIKVDCGIVAEGVKPGDSIAVNGCCLTATEIVGSIIAFDLLHETELKTNLCQVKAGGWVNLERALAASSRYGGHFVTGHVDSTGVIRKWERVGSDFELVIGITRAEGAYLVPKGCIAIDGISLTVVTVNPEEFSVCIIPHTRQVTTLDTRFVGDQVNLEFDLLAKYVEKIIAQRDSGPK